MNLLMIIKINWNFKISNLRNQQIICNLIQDANQEDQEIKVRDPLLSRNQLL